jgi:ketopantoate reductase
LCVETPAGKIVIQPAKATDDPMQIGPVDVIFVGVKAWQVEEAAKDMRGPWSARKRSWSRSRMALKHHRN